jgi:hypothetical protein
VRRRCHPAPALTVIPHERSECRDLLSTRNGRHRCRVSRSRRSARDDSLSLAVIPHERSECRDLLSLHRGKPRCRVNRSRRSARDDTRGASSANGTNEKNLTRRRGGRGEPHGDWSSRRQALLRGPPRSPRETAVSSFKCVVAGFGAVQADPDASRGMTVIATQIPVPVSKPQSLRSRYTPAPPIVQSSTRHACAFHQQLVVLEARPTSRVR